MVDAESVLDRGWDREGAEGVGSIATYIWSQCLPLKAMLLHGRASSRLHFRPFLVGTEASWSKVIEISSVVARNGWIEGRERRPWCRMRTGSRCQTIPFHISQSKMVGYKWTSNGAGSVHRHNVRDASTAIGLLAQHRGCVMVCCIFMMDVRNASIDVGWLDDLPRDAC